MHPALLTRREYLRAKAVRLMSYVGGAALLSILAALYFQPPAPIGQVALAPPDLWIEIERPLPAFSLTIPEAADVPSGYVIRRHATGEGRKDILTLGDANSAAPYLQVEIYRPGTEIAGFAAPAATIEAAAAALGPVDIRYEMPLPSKFGLLDIVTFETAKGPPRKCLGFVRGYDDPMLQLHGWFCQGEAYIERTTLACALDRLSLLSAGSEPKVGALFAQIELNRSFCGQRDQILASTPKYRLLWKAHAERTERQRQAR